MEGHLTKASSLLTSRHEETSQLTGGLYISLLQEDSSTTATSRGTFRNWFLHCIGAKGVQCTLLIGEIVSAIRDASQMLAPHSVPSGTSFRHPIVQALAPMRSRKMNATCRRGYAGRFGLHKPKRM
eukprot:3457467-Amphidinium_carterae.1